MALNNRPILRGRDIKRYGYEWANMYVILAVYGTHKIIPERYPSVYQHLLKFKNKLEKRGQCRYLSSGKTNDPNKPGYPGYPGMHHWLELDNNIRKDYMDLFSKPYICWADIATEPRFAIVDDGTLINNTAYLITGDSVNENLLAALNSKIVKWYFPKASSDLGESGSRYFKQFVVNLPLVKNYIDTNDFLISKFGFTVEEINLIDSQCK